MATSIFLARLIGPLLLIAVGLGLLVNRTRYRALADEFLRSRALIYPLRRDHTAGRASRSCSRHNVWTADWRVLITLLGWLIDRSAASSACSAPQRAAALAPHARQSHNGADSSPAPSGSCSVPCCASSAISADNRITRKERHHEQAVCRRRSRHPEGHDRPARRPRARSMSTPGRRARPARAAARDRARSEGSGEPPLPVYDTTGPYTDNDVAIDVEKGLKRARIEWVKERGGVEEYEGRADQAGRQRQRHRQAPRARFPEHAEAAARARRHAGHAIRIRAAPASSPRR